MSTATGSAFDSNGMITQKQLRANAEQYVRDMSAIFVKGGMAGMDEQTIQYTTDRVVKAMYPSIAKHVY
jgi:hypothetical protein